MLHKGFEKVVNVAEGSCSSLCFSYLSCFVVESLVFSVNYVEDNIFSGFISPT